MYALGGASGIVLCGREFMNSLDESSLAEIKAAINDEPWLKSMFDVGEKYVRTRDGLPGRVDFKFSGLRHNIDSIKSKSRILILWVDEAEPVSEAAWRKIVPTVREHGSEIWVTWNPEDDDSATHKRFRQNPPANSKVVEMNYTDNPWFPDVLEQERLNDLKNRPEDYEHVWGGGFKVYTEQSYYGSYLAQARADERIGKFPYDPELPVETAWDIGVDDYTAIWFFQQNGKQVRAIDYFEVNGEGAEWIVREALDAKPYEYARHWLPHDVRVREWGGGARRRIDTLRTLGVSPIRVGAALGPVERINASRQLMPLVWFNEATCATGLKRLRNYRRKHNESLDTYLGPLHDENSHGADAFGEYAVNSPLVRRQQRKSDQKSIDYNAPTGASEGDGWRL